MRRRHPRHELIREELQRAAVEPQPLEACARERHVESPIRSAHVGTRDRAAHLAEPAPPRSGVLDRQEQEGRRPQVAVAPGDEPLDVVEVERSQRLHPGSLVFPAQVALEAGADPLVLLDVDRRQPAVGGIPDPGRHLMQAQVVLEGKLVLGAAEHEPPRLRVADAVEKTRLRPQATLSMKSSM